MTRIAHLSDLHFGFHRQALVGPLLDRVNRARADLVVVTGDVTHRGRPAQFRDAARFLERINAPVMAVPGNHDVPLYNIPVRFVAPWVEYRQAIDPQLAPTRAAGRVRVLGLNSVDPFTWQRGVIRDGEIGRLIAGLDALTTNIVALHHPLQHLPGIDKQLARRAPQALRRLEDAGAQIVLSGHLHLWTAQALLAHGHRHILQIQAGTALCARLGDLQNEFAVLEIEGDHLTIERHIARMDEDGFRPPEMLAFRRGVQGWQALDPATPTAQSAARGQPVPTLPGATETAFSTA